MPPRRSRPALARFSVRLRAAAFLAFCFRFFSAIAWRCLGRSLSFGLLLRVATGARVYGDRGPRQAGVGSRPAMTREERTLVAGALVAGATTAASAMAGLPAPAAATAGVAALC